MFIIVINLQWIPKIACYSYVGVEHLNYKLMLTLHHELLTVVVDVNLVLLSFTVSF